MKFLKLAIVAAVLSLGARALPAAAAEGSLLSLDRVSLGAGVNRVSEASIGSYTEAGLYAAYSFMNHLSIVGATTYKINFLDQTLDQFKQDNLRAYIGVRVRLLPFKGN